MATYNLGQAAIVSKGAYSASTSYAALNAVSHLGGAFLCKQACTGIEPGVTSGWETYWMNITRGMKEYSVSVSDGTATATIVFTDGTNYQFSYPTSAIAAGAVGTEQLAPGAVTAPKRASNLTYAAVNLNENQVRPIYVQASVPTSSSPDGIYLVTG